MEVGSRGQSIAEAKYNKTVNLAKGEKETEAHQSINKESFLPHILLYVLLT